MPHKKKLHGYDDGWDTAEKPSSDWNMIIEINNSTSAAKMFFGDHKPPLTSIHHLQQAKAQIEKFLEKHEA